MKISKYYHQEKQLTEEVEWRNQFRSGAEVETGKKYSAIRLKNRTIDGPFTALAYENGILLVGDPAANRYAVIHEDVSDVDGMIVTAAIRGGVFGMKADLEEMPDGGEAVEWLRRASQVKFFFTLSENEARLFLKWLRSI